MPTVALFKQDGTQNGDITLNEEIFGIEPNESVVYDAIVMQISLIHISEPTRQERSA
ncbi:50S ribosomal protein L4, partial [Enterococcus sp. S181_ASV_20]|nr:50S ribosomal protein L4 [Enterococcus sp. S181_ASV_20]